MEWVILAWLRIKSQQSDESEHFYETEGKKQQTNQFWVAAEQQSLPDSLVKNHLKLNIDLMYTFYANTFSLSWEWKEVLCLQFSV